MPAVNARGFPHTEIFQKTLGPSTFAAFTELVPELVQVTASASIISHFIMNFILFSSFRAVMI